MSAEHDLAPEKACLLDGLRALPAETEWVEFKHDFFESAATGQYLSALANSAQLCGKPNGYLVFGIKDGTHEVVGTKLRPGTERVDNGPLENWLAIHLEPRIGFEIHAGLYQGKFVVLFMVDPAPDRPVEFKREAWVRVGSAKKKLREHPEKERKLSGMRDDWSAQVCPRATYDHLDPEAMAKARALFKGKNPKLAAEVDGWDDRKFLTKAKAAIEGELTNAAILLLGKEEAEPLLQPAVVWLRWSLRQADGGDENYEDFRTPVLLAVDRLFAKVRNLKLRYLPDGTLFPVEADQYDFLRKQKLVEGRWGAYHLAAHVAFAVDAKAEYIKARGLDTRHYGALLIEYLRKFGSATRQDIDRLLLDKLPEVLDDHQKANRIHNLLTALKAEGRIKREGTRRSAVWKLEEG